MDNVLVVAWLVLAHLVADFVLQNDWIAINKGTGGSTGWAALGTHGFHVALCLLPAVFAFGLPGLVYLVVIAVSHILVDRWKVRATRRAETASLEAARKRMALTGQGSSSGLGNAWTPWPGMLFLADQFLHLTIAIVGWLVILAGATLLPAFVDFVNAILRDWDRSVVSAVILTTVVLVSLFLVNTRGAYYFLMALASPRELPAATVDAEAGPAAEGTPAVPAPVPARTSSAPTGASARVAVTVMAIERILIVGFVLAGAELMVGVLIAVDAFVRWRQFEDRGFVDWYLLSTTGSVLVALSSGLIARAALSTLGG
jgi:hypothetical protein